MKWFDIADELLPPVYKAIKDMYSYARSLDTEFRTWTSYMERILNNFFIQRCDTQTVEYWEEKLGITMFQDETLDQRRLNILEHLNNTNPTTEPYVRSILERMFPDDDYDLWFDVEHDNPYNLNVDVFTSDKEALKQFNEWLFKMCPAHIYPIVSRCEQTEFERPVIMNYAVVTSLISDLGLVNPINISVYDALMNTIIPASLDSENGIIKYNDVTETLVDFYSLHNSRYGIIAFDNITLYRGTNTYSNCISDNTWLDEITFEVVEPETETIKFV